MNPVKMATDGYNNTELTLLLHSIRFRLARSFCSCFIKNAHLASLGAEAGILMAAARKAALVVEDGELVGIFTPKDLMSRAVAKECVLELTAVSSVMTPNPESVLPDVTVLEALQTMHEYKFLSLPVCESDGTVVGLVDVMDLIQGCGGAEGWRSIFASINDDCDDCDDDDTSSTTGSIKSTISAIPEPLKAVPAVKKIVERPVSKVSERSERALRKTIILAMNPAKWLHT